MVSELTASVFNKFMTSGRTSPMLATCITPSDEDIDVIVKLNGAMDLGSRGAVFELVGSLMASKLGIECPKPYLVWFSPQFVDVVSTQEPTMAEKLRRSIGWNFGSELLKDVAVWTPTAAISTAMASDALGIFSFDGLIQNPDRCFNNPNLMTRGEKLTVFDHECAFSFLLSFLPSSKPWMLGTGDYMDRHALRNALKGHSLDWALCRKGLLQLTGEFFDSIGEELPSEWNGGQDIAAIKQHVASVLENVELFETELQRRIA